MLMVFSYLPIMQEHNGMHNYTIIESSFSISGLPVPAYFVGVQYSAILQSIHMLFFFSFHTQQSLLLRGSQRYFSESAAQIKVR